VYLRRSILACGLLLAFSAITATAMAASRSSLRGGRATRAAVAYYGREIRALRAETWYWQRLMGVPRSRIPTRGLATASTARLQQLDAVWRRRERKAHGQAQHPPFLRAWLCIHHYEGSWRDNGAPYWGGLQMDHSFQQTYGGWLLRRKGTANNWTPLEQIWTAVRAARSRGFYPWPNTARFCGLI
jgi:hypothetical protein